MITSRAFQEFDPEARLYCSVAAAILGAGALSAGASVFGSSNAADAQREAADKSIANQQQMYEQNKNLLSPFINAGQQQIGSQQQLLDPNNTSSPLNALMKLLMPGADQSATLEQTPGYQFANSQGLRSANNALAARGLGGSGGAVAKGAASFSSGLASQTWQSVVNSLQNLFSGQAGAGQNLINTGASSGNALAGVGSNVANANSQALIGAGNASAASSNAIGSAIGGLGNSLGSAYLANQMGSNGVYGGSGATGDGSWYGASSLGGPNGPTPLAGY